MFVELIQKLHKDGELIQKTFEELGHLWHLPSHGLTAANKFFSIFKSYLTRTPSQKASSQKKKLPMYRKFTRKNTNIKRKVKYRKPAEMFSEQLCTYIHLQPHSRTQKNASPLV